MLYLVESIEYPSETVPGRTCGCLHSRPFDADVDEKEMSKEFKELLAIHPGAYYRFDIVERNYPQDLSSKS